jgi:hypothetical protein
MNPRNFKAPFISKDEIWQRADEFRAEVWPSGEIPVNIMDIVEFDLGMEFRAVSSLRTDDDVDALLLGDWQTIMVDQGLFMDDRYSNRLRFSIAHELGHYVLHRDVFDQIPHTTTEEWICFMRDIPEKEYSFIEYHAYEFAGRFMVPPVALTAELEKALVLVEKNGLSRAALCEDAHLAYIATGIAKAFDLSSDVIERRLKSESLWPLK